MRPSTHRPSGWVGVLANRLSMSQPIPGDCIPGKQHIKSRQRIGCFVSTAGASARRRSMRPVSYSLAMKAMRLIMVIGYPNGIYRSVARLQVQVERRLLYTGIRRRWIPVRAPARSGSAGLSPKLGQCERNAASTLRSMGAAVPTRPLRSLRWYAACGPSPSR